MRLFLKRASVVGAEPLGHGFHMITLESPQFRTVEWTPGEKVQIALGSAFVNRTYTPIDWHKTAGRTCFLAYAHGSGPGSDWARGVRVGDECDVFGPRASLDVSGFTGPVILLGDETSFGLALAMRQRSYAASVDYVFEVNSFEASKDVLERVDFGPWQPVERLPDDAHLREIEELLPTWARQDTTFVLTGKSTTLQRARQALKRLNVPAARLMIKAYWAPGKAGLD